ncbi:MAG: DUF5723 family protein [Prevotellaceae bacterium]|jgi:hypothetical protein|nr:DUF5723 family protein [Prevotellaceae bacterium]
MKKAVLLISAFSLCLVSAAQQNMTLYQMHNILQSNSLNPAIASECRWNVGVPLLGGVSFAASTPMAYNTSGAGQETFDVDGILSSLKSTNLVSSNAGVNLLMLGYRTENLYFQFNVNERASFSASVPEDLVKILFAGNSPYVGKKLNQSVSVSGMHYREYALSAALGIDDDTWIGLRGRLLFGRLSVMGVRNNVSVYTDPSTYNLDIESDMLMRVSIPSKEVNAADSGWIKGFSADLTPGHFIMNPSNLGGALDIGLNKRFESGLNLSASILNLGMLKWKRHAHTFAKKHKKTYSAPFEDFSVKSLTDTVKYMLQLKDDGETTAYSQWLAPTLMFGLSYPVAEYVRLGVTGYGEFNSSGVPWALTLTAMTDNISNVYGALSYTVTNNSFVNIGAGIGVQLGPVALHAFTDNLISVFSPFTQKYAAVQLGINLKFGCEEDDGYGRNSGRRSKYRSIPCPSFSQRKPCPSRR